MIRVPSGPSFYPQTSRWLRYFLVLCGPGGDEVETSPLCFVRAQTQDEMEGGERTLRGPVKASTFVAPLRAPASESLP